MTGVTDTNIGFKYPLYASDYLDASNYNGNGSVAGLVSADDKIVIGYSARLTYEEAVKWAKLLNEKKDKSLFELIRGSAKKLRI